ncbi:MAG TPA: LysR family transcriptional regulator [Chromatiales bacterium]|nr:LysR family transcriptional regulator [Chromatiales bacterium]
MTGMYYKQNRLKQLRAFCQTARLGTVTKAAEKLYASQPTISLQIQALEREMNTKLFERRGPNLKLTVEGEILFDLAQPLVQGVDHLQETFEAHCGNLTSGELTIAAGESTILYILPEPVRRFVEQYPGIRLKLANVTGRDGLAMLHADETDFAVGSMLEIPDDIEYDPIVTFNPVLIAPPGHPITRNKTVTLEDISPHGLILPPSHLSTWRIVKMIFAQHNVSYRVALEAGGWEVIKRYVRLGLGIAIVTDVCLTEADRETFAVIPLTRYFPKRSYGIVTRKGRFLSAPAKRFIDIMQHCFADSGSEGSRASSA